MLVSPSSLPRMNVQQYLDYEASQDIRHELVDGYLYAMTGASERHEQLSMNLAAALSVHLRGGACRVYKSDLKIAVGNDFYYPDVFVSCGEANPDGYSRSDPVMIAEVLSPSTQRNDRGDKRLAYESLPSLREYVLIWQDRIRVEVRTVDSPDVQVLEASNDVISLASLDFTITLEALYA